MWPHSSSSRCPTYVGTEHILLALLELEDGTGVLAGLGLDKAAAEATIAELISALSGD